MANIFTDEDASRYKNKTAVDYIIPKTYAVILEWGCPKLPDETFRDVLIRKKSDSDYRKCAKKYNHAVGLDCYECTNLDAGFMQKYIPDACEDLDLCTAEEKKKKDESNPNYILFSLKKIRNDISHQPTTSAISSVLLDEIDRVSAKSLRVIGTLYGIEVKTIDEKIGEINALVQQVKDAVEKDDSARTRQHEILLCIDGMREVKEKIGQRQYVLLPSSRLTVFLSDVFHDVHIVITDDSQTSGTQGLSIVPSSELGKSLKNIRLFIEGIAFSGKSTLLRKLREDFLEKYKPVFPGKSEKYTIVLLMECQNRRITTIADLLKENFPDTLLAVDAKTAADSLRSAKLLILVDGLDELNQCSETLLNTLIDKFGTSKRASFIFTSRTGTSQTVKAMLDSKGLPYQTGSLQPIPPEEHTKFLDRYRENIPQPKTSNVVQGFESLDEISQEYLTWPGYLALFVHLYHTSDADNKYWNTQSNLIDQTLLVLKRMSIQRMYHEGYKNYEICTTEILEAIYDLSLQLCHQNQDTINQDEMDNMFKKITRKRTAVPQKFLSCFYKLHDKTYSAMNPAHSCFMAAKAICTRFDRNPEASVIATICDVLEEDTINEERFRGTFRFVLMILLDNHKTDLFLRCLSEIRDVLVRTNTDFGYWVELTSSCPSSVEVAEVSAETAMMQTWTVESSRHMNAISRMIRHKQPDDLIVTPNSTKAAAAALRPLLENISERYSGKLVLRMRSSYYEFSSVDDFVIRLKTAKCLLVEFLGCLGSNVMAVDILAACLRRTTERGLLTKLHISLEKPRAHKLDGLNKLQHDLEVRVRAKLEDDDEGRCPLPHGLNHRTVLIVETSLTSDAEGVTNLIKDLLPKDNRFRRLCIQNYPDADDEREELLQSVSAAGVRTECGESQPSWIFAGTHEDSTCQVCGEKVHRTAERCVELLLP